jgi:hypothetical protein
MIAGLSAGCESKVKKSVAQAKQHVELAAGAIQTDVEEVRKGLPEGAKQLAPLYQKNVLPQDDLQGVRDALERARNKVQDLRVAKSTFFALADDKGTILRNDQEQDLMAGKSLFGPFPELKKATEGRYVETRGSMPEAVAVRGRPDGQWVAAQPIAVDGAVRGLYVTGWAWSAYAYRLENAVRGAVRSELAKSSKEPLVYVYVLADGQAHGAPISPDVNAKAITDLQPLSKITGDAPFSAELEITGRDFGLAVRKTPMLGPDTGVAVLRSET